MRTSTLFDATGLGLACILLAGTANGATLRYRISGLVDVVGDPAVTSVGVGDPFEAILTLEDTAPDLVPELDQGTFETTSYSITLGGSFAAVGTDAAIVASTVAGSAGVAAFAPPPLPLLDGFDSLGFSLFFAWIAEGVPFDPNVLPTLSAGPPYQDPRFMFFLCGQVTPLDCIAPFNVEGSISSVRIVPEPTTALLAALGLLALSARRAC